MAGIDKSLSAIIPLPSPAYIRNAPEFAGRSAIALVRRMEGSLDIFAIMATDVLRTFDMIDALALRKISLAWRSSRFSRSSAFIFSANSVGIRRACRWDLGLLDPFIQRMRRATDLRGDRHNGLSTRTVLAFGVMHQPNRALAHLRGKLVRRLAHDAPS